MTTVWQEQLKNPIDFLLCEDSSFLTEEDGTSLLVLEQSGTTTNLWSLQTKN